MLRSTGRAFTLIELLVAITIVALLVAAAAVSLQAAQSSARDSQRISDLSTLGKAVDAYYLANHGRYPVAAASSSCANTFGTQLNSYLPNASAFPADPRPLISSNSACTDYTYGYKYYANAAGNAPASLSEAYIFVAGLEKDPSSENNSVMSAAALPGISASARKPYYLPGTYCGTNC